MRSRGYKAFLIPPPLLFPQPPLRLLEYQSFDQARSCLPCSAPVRGPNEHLNAPFIPLSPSMESSLPKPPRSIGRSRGDLIFSFKSSSLATLSVSNFSFFFPDFYFPLCYIDFSLRDNPPFAFDTYPYILISICFRKMMCPPLYFISLFPIDFFLVFFLMDGPFFV